jgi:ATP synthase protein I
MSRVFIAQILLILAVAIAYLALAGIPQAKSALYGGAIALANTWLLARRMAQLGALVTQGSQRGTVLLYFGALQRFALTLGLLILGLGGLKLAPVPMIAAFALAQLGFLGTLFEVSRPS